MNFFSNESYMSAVPLYKRNCLEHYGLLSYGWGAFWLDHNISVDRFWREIKAEIFAAAAMLDSRSEAAQAAIFNSDYVIFKGKNDL